MVYPAEPNVALTESGELQRNLSVTFDTDKEAEQEVSPPDTAPLLDTYNERFNPQTVESARLQQLADEIVLLLPEPKPNFAKRIWEWFKNRVAGTEWFKRLSEWLERVAPSLKVPTSIFWIFALSFIAGTLGFVFYELYKAGVFQRSHQRDAAILDASGSEVRLGRGRDVRNLQGISQVRALFQNAVGKLRGAGALPESDSLTNQSLARLLQRRKLPADLAPDVSEKFSALVQHTDLALYADQLPNSPEWQSLVEYWVAEDEP